MVHWRAAGAPLRLEQEQSGVAAEEQQWAARARSGDLVAFNAIVERYQAMAYNLALRMLHDQASAEDVTQEAFFSAYRNIARYRGGSLRSWLLTIVANRARDVLRSPSRKRSFSLEARMEQFGETGGTSGPWVDPSDQPQEAAERAETARLVRNAIAQLPDDQGLVVTLVDLQGLDYDEASRVAGVKIGTVKSRLFRARQRLRESLRDLVELSGQQARQTGEEL